MDSSFNKSVRLKVFLRQQTMNANSKDLSIRADMKPGKRLEGQVIFLFCFVGFNWAYGIFRLYSAVFFLRMWLLRFFRVQTCCRKCSGILNLAAFLVQRYSSDVTHLLMLLSNYDDDDDDDNVKKEKKKQNNWFYEKNNGSSRASRLVHFFDVHCTTTT